MNDEGNLAASLGISVTKIASGDEYPSGLRDAIAEAEREWVESHPGLMTSPTRTDHMLAAVAAWLSVVSEDEIAATARVMSEELRKRGHPVPLLHLEFVARSVLAASRGVLLPKETT